MIKKLKLASMRLAQQLEPGVSGLPGLTVLRLVDLDTETELVHVDVQLQLMVENTVLEDCIRIKDSARSKIAVFLVVGAPGLAGLPVVLPVEPMVSERDKDTAAVPSPYTLEHYTTAEESLRRSLTVTTTASMLSTITVCSTRVMDMVLSFPHILLMTVTVSSSMELHMKAVAALMVDMSTMVVL